MIFLAIIERTYLETKSYGIEKFTFIVNIAVILLSMNSQKN